jgi:hypothetical protein
VMQRVRDPVSLVAGAMFMALGALLILDQAGALELTLGWVGAALAASLGAILVASGLAERGEEPANTSNVRKGPL